MKTFDDEPRTEDEPSGSDHRESLARAVNNLEASEARVRRNAERVYDEARTSVVRELLPVLDNVERMLIAERGHPPTPLVEGVTLVRGQLEGVLSRFGVERIDARGIAFDPALHEAVTAISVEAARVGMVLDQFEPGYRFNNKLLRPARVSVGVTGK